jgi:hypothetical protein
MLSLLLAGTFGHDQSSSTSHRRHRRRALRGRPGDAASLLSLQPFADAFIPAEDAAAATLQNWQSDIYGLTMILVVILAPGASPSFSGHVVAHRLKSTCWRSC